MVTWIIRWGLCAVFLFATTASAYLYKIHNHPSEDRGVSCQDRAAEYANALASMDGVEIQGAACSFHDLLSRNQVSIRYTAPRELNLVSSYTLDATYEHKGIYNTLAECLENLPADEAIFRQETGVEVFISFCARESANRQHPWYPHIDGFGNAERFPDRLSWRTNRFHGVEHSELFAEISGRLASRGIDLKHLTFRPGFATSDATLFFYGPTKRIEERLSSQYVATIPGLSACRSQLAKLRDQLTSSYDSQVLTGYCSSAYSNPKRFELTLVYWRLGFVESVYSGESFPDLASCLPHEESIGHQLRSIHGDRLAAAFCGTKTFSNSREPMYRVVGVLF